MTYSIWVCPMLGSVIWRGVVSPSPDYKGNDLVSNLLANALVARIKELPSAPEQLELELD